MVAHKFIEYLKNCTAASELKLNLEDGESHEVQDAIRVATVAMSLLGFLDAAAAYANFWTSTERLDVINRVQLILSESFLVTVETALSTIRNSQSQSPALREWKRYVRHYAGTGRPLGAMLLQRSFLGLLVAVSSLLVADVDKLRGVDVLDLLLTRPNETRLDSRNLDDAAFQAIETIMDVASNGLGLLEDGADYLRLGSTWQQRLAFSVKAAALMNYITCCLLHEEAADTETLASWLEDTLADPVQMADPSLASVVLRSMALLSRLSPAFAPSATRLLPRFIVQGGPRGDTIHVAAQCLARILQRLSQDAVITTMYTLGNVLSSGASVGGIHGEVVMDGPNSTSALYHSKLPTGSSISLTISGDEETSIVHGNVVQAICGIAKYCNDPKITALAQSMLLQKIEKVSKSVDARIITEAATLAMIGGPQEFRSLLKLYAKLCQDAIAQSNNLTMAAVSRGYTQISSTVARTSSLYDIYLDHLLETIISSGDAHQGQINHDAEVEIAASTISQLLQPLAVLLLQSAAKSGGDIGLSEETASLMRDAWFNMVVHGFGANTERGKIYVKELRIIAIHSKPLVTEQRGEQVESDIELNTILRRGLNPENENLQRKRLVELLPSKASEIRGLSYRKVIFLQAAHFVETLRSEAGECTKAFTYFLEPSMRKGDMSSAMEAITDSVMDIYLSKAALGGHPSFSAQYVAKQLVRILCGCCHRIERVREAAFKCADKLIHDVPSALCQRSSLFALCELLSIMWTSCLEAETDEYAWKSTFSSVRGGVSVELSDDYDLRQKTLDKLHRKAQGWVITVINNAPLDVKGLLQTYLSEYVDDGAYGHISLGRSFANEMGAVVPSNDQKLVAIRQKGIKNINTASDFIAQYTTRQEYRHAEIMPDHETHALKVSSLDRGQTNLEVRTSGDGGDDAVTLLSQLSARTKSQKYVPIGEVRDILRRAAALLCRSDTDQCAIVHHLVGIPFQIFSKQSIKLGISLWLGVINENPRMESRILVETIRHWEATVHKRLGVFDTAFK